MAGQGENAPGGGDNLGRRSDVLFWSALGVLLVAAVVVTILAIQFPTFPGDFALLVAIQSLRSPQLDLVMYAVTYVGFEPQTLLLTGAAAIVLWIIGLRRAAVFTLFTVLGGVLGVLIKAFVARPRPPDELLHAVSSRLDFGYPSGHALFAVLFYGFLAFIAWTSLRNRLWRLVAVLVLAILALATGISRVYLGSHWPSDVLGGYLIGSALLLALVKLYQAGSWPEQED